MSYQTLISSEVLDQHLSEPNWVIVDCRFSLADTELGRQKYQENHIPGAVYAHLDEDLSGLIVPGETGRHPLPEVATFATTLSHWGIDETTQVVAYDDMGGAIAGRLWWMLRWLGHNAVAVLDGGYPAWQREERATSAEVVSATPRIFTPQPRSELLVGADEVLSLRADPTWRVLDARGGDRYRGENETIDPVGGHIPGAYCAPFAQNLGEHGYFLAADALRDRFAEVLGDISSDQTIVYCGSGVTAAHNVLAMVHAGLGEARLYAGSWSEWLTKPDTKDLVATGPEPL